MSRSIISGVLLMSSFYVYSQTYFNTKIGVNDIKQLLGSNAKISTILVDEEESFEANYLFHLNNGEDLRIESQNVYYYDNGTADVASEGYIRFIDDQTRLVGLYDEKGEVAIPAVYNYLTRVENGLVVGIKGAEKKYLGNDKEHFTYDGGDRLLMNVKGEVLVDDFTASKSLDFFSLSIEENNLIELPCRTYFKGNDGLYYSFVILEDFFQSFIMKDFIPGLRKEGIEQYLQPNEFKLYYQIGDEDEGVYETLIKQGDTYYEVLKNEDTSRVLSIVQKVLSPENKEKGAYFVGNTFLDPSIVGESVYYDGHGEWLESVFPTFTYVITEDNNRKVKQHLFSFFRDINGNMKLYQVYIRNE
ncbi:hypothetical protein [Myroides pelagicus]|uniref:WG repeat-containing protein n=1 Tax=Myroides pelagicus TaxID=270914 RepID=A0A7K1GI53_9FLAO|nr:hypothetical protein [Myroides pelagicus]MEC4112797.1 hypothetical protein [Myroides pelagicus]MTH28607.1 hypothetical protein [Myroides pelagicus]